MSGHESADQQSLATTDKELARHPDAKVRAKLAARTDVAPEILYFLANDTASDVRLNIAANISTPGQAHLILARDKDDHVRGALAGKIAELLPNLTSAETSKVRDLALNTIEVLAQDELPRLRAVISEAVKEMRDVPHDLVRRLAFDIEAIVSTPVLEFSPLLSDEDLLEVISSTSAGGERLSAVARRVDLAEQIADAIARSGDERAVGALLANSSAQIREETLDALVEQSADIESWHQPLVTRPRLSFSAIQRLSSFVADRLVDMLATRHELDPAARAKLQRKTQERLAESRAAEPEEAPAAPPQKSAAERAKAIFDRGKLDDDALDDALDAGDREFVIHGLSLLAKVPVGTVTRIVQIKHARALTALAYRAKLSMRMGMRLQMRLALIPAAKMLNARGGVDYPLTEAELEVELGAFL
jgi:uncharacterized protein (DUF2336 family)